MAVKETGYRGISFPFRIGVKGGVVMSSTSENSIKHITEAIEQILRTRPNERGMEKDFKSDISLDIFDVNDISLHTLVKYQIEEAIRELEDRVEIEDITLESKENILYANIVFNVLTYNTTYETKMRVGEIKR